LRTKTIWIYVGGVVVLVAVIGLTIGLGPGGSSTNDRIVSAYTRALPSPEDDKGAVRADALDLANEVCSLSPEDAVRQFVGITTTPMTFVFAVADVACPDIADAIRAGFAQAHLRP
jgi:hypothetical protein